MRLNDLFEISLRQVLRQRRRNIGAVLAIALGTAGLIVIITMGHNVKEKINMDLELLGGATRIKAYFDFFHEKYSVPMPQWFREDTVNALRRFKGVMGVTAVFFCDGIDICANNNYQYIKTSIVGVDEYFWDVNSFSAAKGKFFGSTEVGERAKVCVLGEDLAKTVFGEDDPVGHLLIIDGNVYSVLGILGGIGLGDRSEKAFVPITTAEDRISRFRYPDQIYVRCNTWNDVEAVASSIPSVVGTHQPAEGLQVKVALEHLKRVKKIAWWVESFVYLAVAATLILGGFGIWNIMMANVRVRTREIGLKKAIGAEDRDILHQFLTEALCLSLGAAFLGIVLGRVAVEALALLLGCRPPEELFVFCVFLGIMFAVILGVGAGLVPSIRASRMEVVAAVRYE